MSYHSMVFNLSKFILISCVLAVSRCFHHPTPISHKNNVIMKAAPKEYKDNLPGKLLVAGRSIYVDPLGISKSASLESIKLWREAELMHGRVSMLAFLHVVFTEFYKYQPLYPDAGDLSINHLSNIPLTTTGLLGVVIGAMEFYRAEKGWLEPTSPENLWTLRDAYEPGDLGFDPLNLGSGLISSKRKLQEQELNNGRLAAIAMAGIVAQELVTNRPVF